MRHTKYSTVATFPAIVNVAAAAAVVTITSAVMFACTVLYLSHGAALNNEVVRKVHDELLSSAERISCQVIRSTVYFHK